MIFRRNRNLIMLAMLYFAILGFFLMGCSEGTDNSPVSALMKDIDVENYTNGGKTVLGSIRTNNYQDELGGIPVKLFRYDNNKNTYVLINETISSYEEDDAGMGMGKFKFAGLKLGTYKLKFEKTKTFKEKEQNFLLAETQEGESAPISGNSDYVSIKATIECRDNEISNLTMKVVNVHNSLPIESASIKIDDKLIDSTNSFGEIVVDDLAVGYHSIEITHPNFVTLKGKFQVEYKGEGYKPTTLGGNNLEFCMVEPGHKSCITGVFYETDSNYEKPRNIRLYKFTNVPSDPSTPNIKRYNVNIKKTTKTSYGIDGLPDGSFKLLDLDPGFYQLYFVYGIEDPKPDPTPLYGIYNLSDNDKDIADYKWQKLLNTDDNGALSRPIEITNDYTVHWSNIDGKSTK